MTVPEFSRTLRADMIGTGPRALQLQAEPAEREALARRFALVALDRLEAEVNVHRAGHDIVAHGRLTADVVQSCVVTDAPVPARVDEAFAVRFRTEAAAPAEDEVELGEDEMDVIFYDGVIIDLGEAAAQTLALSLDPYPRAAAAAAALKEAGVKDESEAGPLGALAGLRDKLAE